MAAARQEPEQEHYEPHIVERPERAPALYRDITRWGPILGGFFATTAVAVLIAVLGAAFGIPTSAAGGFAPIWGGVIVVVSFFVGGYVATRSCARGDLLTAIFNSSVVWALAVTFAVVLGALGLGALFGLIGLGVSSPFMAARAAVATGLGTQMWSACIGICIGLFGAIVGGLLGMHGESERYEVRR